jgi:hypothetical protein
MSVGPGARTAPLASHRAFAIDAAAVAFVSAGICLAAHELAFMTLLVPAVLALRLLAWSRLPVAERGHTFGSELVFFALCTVLGAANDWNSVVRQRIYAYGVPCYFPDLSTVPLWMLAYWGMILRFLATLCRWEGLAPRPGARDDVRLPGRVLCSARAKVLGELLLVVVTRALVYRHYGDPWLSWLPFAAALVLYAGLFRPDRHALWLAVLLAVGGPAVEIAYIRLGGLHDYALGWLAGVPLWIVLWWALAILVWDDLATRILGALARR